MPSTNPVVKELGRKPYINTKGIDGGYVNEMRRTPQGAEPPPEPEQKRSRGATVDPSKLITRPGLISEYMSGKGIWGMTFDRIGGLYVAVNAGDIYYRPSGSAVFGALSQPSIYWGKMACAPNGDIYAMAWNEGIFIRAGGVGDFVLFESGDFSFPLAADPNGDIYAMKTGELYVRTSGALSFTSVGITPLDVIQDYQDLTCGLNGDLYTGVWGPDWWEQAGVWVRTGRVGDFVKIISFDSVFTFCTAPNGDIYMATFPDSIIYKQTGGVGDFVVWFDVSHPGPARAVQDMSVSLSGYLSISSGEIL